jgi:hypothetical protein
MITFTVIDKDFQREMEKFIRQSDREFKSVIRDSSNHLVKMAKLKVRNFTRRSKVKSRTLINGIRKNITNKGLTGEVLSSASYSEAFEYGTRPHTIRVKNKGVLAGPYRGRPPGWYVSKKSKSMGFATYGKKVQHPGTQAHPFMYPAWRYAVDYFEKQIIKIFR